MIACYCRVSTNEQSLERQLEATTEYARDRLDADLAEIEVYRDRSTGTDTSRDGPQYRTAGGQVGLGRDD